MTGDTQSNRRIVLAARPKAEADLGCFRLETVPIDAPRDGEVLLRTEWLSLDPYMRGRMSDAPSYAAPVAVGAAMLGETVARVDQSLNPNFRVGELVLSANGWQEVAISNGNGLVKLPAALPRPSYALGVMGMPGFTAYVGLLDVGKPRAGETVVVAAATGAVGSVVGQIAKIKGCRVVGVAGGAEKCAWAVEQLGFDACIDHRSAAFDAELAAACAGGIDVYYENVGGKVFRAVLGLLNPHARIPVCGLISQYNEPPQAAQRETVQARHPGQAHHHARLHHIGRIRASPSGVSRGDGRMAARGQGEVPRGCGRGTRERAERLPWPLGGPQLREAGGSRRPRRESRVRNAR
jgi:NADPH-dependent curcumin reductase